MIRSESELSELHDWFIKTYSPLEQKFKRRIFLEILNTDGTDPAAELKKLYAQAEVTAARIRELRSLDAEEVANIPTNTDWL